MEEDFFIYPEYDEIILKTHCKFYRMRTGESKKKAVSKQAKLLNHMAHAAELKNLEEAEALFNVAKNRLPDV